MEAQYLMILLVVLLVSSIYYNLKQRNIIREYDESESQLIQKAYFDPITDIPNRKNIDVIITDNIYRASRHKKSFLILAIKMINYYEIKAKSKHESNNLAVKIADIIVESIRDEDTPSRVSEDCFIIVFNEYLDDNKVHIPINRIEQMLDGYKVKIGKSIYPNDADTTKALIEKTLNKTKYEV